MALSILNGWRNESAMTASLLGISNGFKIYLANNRFYEINGHYWRLPLVKSFTGIMTENLSLNFQTSWSDAGGAILGKKIDSFVNSKFIKMLAGQSDAGFMPFICSDAWTQQKVSGEAQPVKVQLKFKAYNEDKLQCTNYNDILRFLIHICSPIKSATGKNEKNDPNSIYAGPVPEAGLGTQLAGTLNNAAAGGGKLINTAVAAGKSLASSEWNSIAQGLKNVVETADRTYNTIVAETGNGKNNGNFTVNLSLGDLIGLYEGSSKIHERSIEANVLSTDGPDKGKKVSKDYNIDWIITNFSFTPSRQFQMVNGLPKPLWMSFDLSLETRLSLSNKYVYNILMKDPLITHTG